MPTLLLLLAAMQCFALAQGGASRERVLLACGLAGLCASLVLSAQAHGVERGVAVWLAFLMAAGMITPVLLTQIAVLRRLAEASRLRVRGLFDRRIRATCK